MSDGFSLFDFDSLPMFYLDEPADGFFLPGNQVRLILFRKNA